MWVPLTEEDKESIKNGWLPDWSFIIIVNGMVFFFTFLFLNLDSYDHKAKGFAYYVENFWKVVKVNVYLSCIIILGTAAVGFGIATKKTKIIKYALTVIVFIQTRHIK